MKRNLLLFMICISTFSFSQDFSTLKKKDLFDVSGSVGANLSFSKYNGRNAMQSPWSYTVSSALNLKVAGFNIPFSFAYVNGDKSYTHPFVRMGISPRYKNIKLHLGYRSMSLAPSVFSGKTFLGAGTELQFGKFNLSGFYGNIEGDRVYDENGYTSKFDRKAYGIKIGVKGSKFFFDITAFKAKDDEEKEKFNVLPIAEGNAIQPTDVNQSTATYKHFEQNSYAVNNSTSFRRYLHRKNLAKYGEKYGDYKTKSSGDMAVSTKVTVSTQKRRVYPADNIAVGANIGFTLFKKISVRSLLSVTGYTQNTKGRAIENLDKGILKRFLEMRVNSRTGYLSNTTVSTQFSNFGMSINHRMISTDYKTLGIANMATNYTSTSFNANSSMFSGKLSLNGFYSIFKNNFNKKQLYTSKRDAYGLSMNAMITDNFTVSGNYNGLHAYQVDGTKQVDEKTKLDMSTHSVNISPTYDISNDKYGHSISVNFDYSTTINNNEQSTYVEDTKNMLLSTSYNLNFRKSNLNTGISYGYNKNYFSGGTDGGHSVGVFASKSFFEKKNLSVNVSLNYGATAYEQEIMENGVLKPIVDNRNSFTASGGMRYSLKQRHNFSLRYTWSSTGYSGVSASQNSFRASVSYSYTLPTLSSLVGKKDKKQIKK